MRLFRVFGVFGSVDGGGDLKPKLPQNPFAEKKSPQKPDDSTCEGFVRHRAPGPHPRIRLALPSSGVDLASIQHRFDIDLTSKYGQTGNRCRIDLDIEIWSTLTLQSFLFFFLAFFCCPIFLAFFAFFFFVAFFRFPNLLAFFVRFSFLF